MKRLGSTDRTKGECKRDSIEFVPIVITEISSNLKLQENVVAKEFTKSWEKRKGFQNYGSL